MVTPAAKREAVAHLRSALDMSERRACRTIGCVRMTVRYRCHRPDAAARRSAALRSTDGFAPRTAATTAQQGITDDHTPIVAG